MTQIFSHLNRGQYQARFSLSPEGKARITLSPPLGLFGEGRDKALDIPSEIQQPQFCPPQSPPCSKLKPGWGLLAEPKPLSYKSQKSIRETIAAMDREYPLGKNPLRILTLTLPSTDPAAFRALAAWASYAINRLNTWIGRQLGEHARAGVWEWQKRGALHYHCVIGANNPWAWRGFAVAAKQQWIEILQDIGSRTGADMFRSRKGGSHLEKPENIQVDCQVVEKSAAAYLSKYLSKGDGIKRRDGSISRETWDAKKNGNFFPPPRWFNCNSAASAIRKKWTKGLIILNFRAKNFKKAYQLCREFMEMIVRPNYKVIETVGKGYAANCIYAIVEDWSDCMDAIPWFQKTLSSLVGSTGKLWHGLRRGNIMYSYTPQYYA